MRPAVLVVARPALAVLTVSSLCWAQNPTSKSSNPWMTQDGGSLQLKLVREGLCGGLLTVDSIRRLLRWEGAPGETGCKDAFEATFEDVKAVRTRSEPGFLLDFKKGKGKRMVLIPLPHSAWLAKKRVTDNSALRNVLESGVYATQGRGGETESLPTNIGAGLTVERIDLPSEVVSDTRQAVDRVLEVLGRPAPSAAVLREALYGRPADTAVEEVLESPVTYAGKAVRLRGRLEAGTGDRTAYRLVDGDQALPVVPEADLASFIQSQVTAWQDQEVELVGLFRRSEDALAGGSGYLVSFWECTAEGEPTPGEGTRTTLAALFAAPAAAVGETVRVVGKFRGRNLFADLPLESIRQGGDWVIKDDRYAIWVIGKPPSGDGFRLDPGAPGDTSSWLEVVGRPVVRGGRLLLQARSTAVVPPPPGARVMPARQILAGREVPPAVVFALPMEGEAVTPDVRFVIQFSKQMDEESFRGRIRLRYTGEAGEGGFQVRARYDEEHRSLVVDPGTSLRLGQQVEIQLLPGIIDADGMPLEPRPGRKAEGAVDVLRYVVGDQG